MQSRRAEILRFLIAGGVTTGATYLLYLALDLAMHYQVAYAIAYAAGVALQYLLHAGFVFKVERSVRGAAAYPVIHVLQYAFNAVLLGVLVDRLGVPSWAGVPIVIAVAIPLNYVVTRWWLTRRR